MKRILSFGTYIFPGSIPVSGEVLRSNFANAVPRVVRLPGMSGGFDEYGSDAAASEIGSVRVRFTLIAASTTDMQTKRDAVWAMARMGRARLIMETFAGVQRWTWARINNINLPTEPDVYAERFVDVTVDFQVAHPLWFSTNPASPLVVAASGAATNATIVNGGTAVAQAAITVTATSAISSGGVRIRRMVGSVVADEIVYAAALANTDVLTLNSQSLTVRKNGVDAYGNIFSANHPAWLRLQPGANTLRVILGAGETANVAAAWEDTWY